MILASILFFVIVWTGTTQALKRIRIIVSYFIWAGRETMALAWVAWSTICNKYRDGSLGILDPEQALIALMLKWVIQAFQLGNSNIQLFMRYRLLHAQPYTRAK